MCKLQCNKTAGEVKRVHFPGFMAWLEGEGTSIQTKKVVSSAATTDEVIVSHTGTNR